ncbi:MAG: hypothetical protein LQ351_002416 [Letrouitia transgressa]|nr:MAG: hypothetical protein LQ351_002416 [Letrouitia transgressa]
MPPRRPRRSQKSSDNSSQAQTNFDSEITSGQKLSGFDVPSDKAGADGTPRTPPKQKKSTIVQANGPSDGNASAGDAQYQKRNHKKTKPPKNMKTSSIIPMSNDTPRSENRPKSFQLTPGKKNVTPSRPYAGPTFHASPAASSLPIPKFYSKSVPELNKAPSMQTMMEKEVLDSSSDHSGNSPTPGFSQRAGEQRTREESPLDIFFQADRQEKEKKRKEKESAIATASGGQSTATDSPDCAEPLSTYLAKTRHHSRQSTNGSAGLFPLEMDDKATLPASHEKAASDPTPSTAELHSRDSALRNTLETPEQEKQRKAKTEALKKLLLSQTARPIPNPRPLISDGTFETRSSHCSSPETGQASLAQALQKPSSPLLHKQLAAAAVRKLSTPPRPVSTLRQGHSASDLSNHEHAMELPATPTPSKTRHTLDYSQGSYGVTLPWKSPSSTSTTASKQPQSSVASQPIRDSSPFKTMEDDLRRILKMDCFPSDGATGVKS